MCGITGAVWLNAENRLAPEALDRMTDILAHRGPDGRGTHWHSYENGAGVGLGHRRLSIIDLGGGKQPLANEDGQVWVTFNGEIYNYQELRRQLIDCGHVFRTDSDTEVIVHGYEQWGDACVARFRGMFAFAVWDGRKRRTLLARDRMGKKPLLYAQRPGRLLFASEIKSLLASGDVPRDIDPLALDEYLTYTYVPHPRTIFTSIKKLPPAHLAVYENDRLTLSRYWNPDFNAETSRPVAEIRAELRERLDDAVRMRLRSDVPLGAFLSGGIDSTAVVGLMAENMSQPVKTYTIGFAEKEYDESPFARIAADHLRADHHELHVAPASIEILPTLAWHFDEPFADSSAIPTYFVAQATREHVTVALTGDGGDELFAGYPRYVTVEQAGRWDHLPSWLRSMATGRVWDLLPANHREDSTLRKIRFRMERLRETRADRYARWVSCFQRESRQSLYTAEFAGRLTGSAEEFVTGVARDVKRSSAGKQAMMTDLQTYLPCDLLAKVDIMSMAHGLECRCPFLDDRVVELAASIPYRYLYEGEGAKPLLTSTLPEIVPPVLRKRSKMGFCVPLNHWFRGPLRSLAEEFLLSERALARGYFRRAGVEQLLQEHQSGAWNHGDRLWSLLSLEAWHRTYIDPDAVPAAPLEDLLPSTAAAV